MVKFGINSWVWVYPSDISAIRKAEEIGYDGIEIPIEDPKIMNVKKFAQALKSSKLECSSICAVMASDRDLKSPDPAIRKNAKTYIKTSVDCAVEFGTSIVAGPLYSAVAPTLATPDIDAEWKVSVQGLKEVSRYAEDRGVYLALEPLNRFENHLVNTVAQVKKMLSDIDSPAIKIHFDTFHANIEEQSIGGAIRDCDRLLYHFHACENDRGTPGKGHIPWDEVASAVKDIQYDRYVVIETFQPGIKEIATAAAIWRPLATSQDSLASEGLSFLKEIMKSHA